jgi:cytochrome c oxidase subunit 2
MLLIGAFASVIGVALSLWIDWFPVPASDAAHDIDTLWDVLLIFSVPVFVLVMTIALYSVWKFRAKPGQTGDGAPIHGNTTLEIIWVTIPFLMVSGLAIYGWIVLDDIEAKKPDTMVVKVTGQQFTWSFQYPEQRVRSNRLVLPKDRPVEFRINTKDVIHSFWVPEFRLKSDAVPGLTTTVRLTPDRTGNWQVVCAELCGLGHSTMRQRVSVVEPGRFDEWVRERASGGMAGGGRSPAAAGKELFTATGCGGCHTLADAGSSGTTGPELDDLAASAREAGESPEEYVRRAIVEPDAFVVEGFPKGTMPGNYGDQLAPEEIDALVDYLLEEGGGRSQ